MIFTALQAEKEKKQQQALEKLQQYLASQGLAYFPSAAPSQLQLNCSGCHLGMFEVVTLNPGSFQATY